MLPLSKNILTLVENFLTSDYSSYEEKYLEVTMLSYWQKPRKIQFEDIWSTFFGKRGALCQIRHLDEEWRNKAVDLILELMLNSDPILRQLCNVFTYSNVPGVPSDSNSIASLKDWIERYLFQNISFGCFVVPDDSSISLVAVDLLHVRTANDQPQDLTAVKGEAFKLYLEIQKVIESRINIFELYGVLKYMSSFSLVVSPKYNKWRIEKEMINIRQRIAKALGIEVITSVFVEQQIQMVPNHCWYQVICEISEKEMHENNIVTVFENVYPIKIMCIQIPVQH